MSLVRKLIKQIVYALPSSYILMFHHVTDQPVICNSGCVLNEKRFFDVIDSIADYSSVADCVMHYKKRNVGITFDDGLEDVYQIAYPYLKSKGIPFTVFVVCDFLDGPGYITTKQLRTLASDPLVTVGSHGMTHELISEMSSEKKRFELVESQKRLEDIIGRKIELFAYSHGAYDDETLDIVSDYYKMAFSTIPRPINHILMNSVYEVPRLNIDNTCVEESMKIVLKGLKIDGWK